MTKNMNMKALMAGTTTLLLGMNVFATPVQAALAGAATGQKIAETSSGDESGAPAGTNNGNDNPVKANPESNGSSEKGNKAADNAQGQSGTEETSNDNPATESQEENGVGEAPIQNSGIYSDNTEVTVKKDGKDTKTTIGEVAKDLDRNNALGIAGMFGVFSKKTTVSVDFSSNVATKEYNNNGQTTGTNGVSPDLVKEDISYIGKADNLAANEFGHSDKKIVIIENDNPDITTNKDNQVLFKGQRLDHLKANELKITSDKDYINFDEEFDKLSKKSQYFTDQKQSDGVKSSLSDRNNRWIDISNATPDKETNAIYVDLDAKYLDECQLTIKGLKKDSKNPVVIINVRNTKDEMNCQFKTWLSYGENSNNEMIAGASEGHKYANNILWHFGTNVKKLTIGGDHLLGSVLATDAAVTTTKNVDGNIVAKEVVITGGEFHRWDLNTNLFVNPKNQDPKNQDPKNQDPKSQDPKKEDPSKPNTPKPKDEIPPFPFNPAYPAIPDHNVPDNPTTPDFFKPQPKNPVPDQPVTPSFSEPKSKTPFPDAGTHSISTPNDDVETFFKAQAKANLVSKKVSVRGKTESAKPVISTPKTMVEHANVGGKVATPQAKKLSSLKSAPQTKKAASLPQTGQKQNNIALLGLGLVLSAAALAIGFFDKTKKN